ncbi:hypothetical protein Tco_0409413 [Tanacetum coccineum]
MGRNGRTFWKSRSRENEAASDHSDYLAATSATYYYLNPIIPEAEESRALYKVRHQQNPPLIICKYPYKNIQQEKLRNRFPLQTIMEQNPESYKRYITDASGTAPLTFFTPAADKLTCHSCAKLIEKYDPTDPMKIPPEVLAVQGKSSIFQFHFNSLANTTDFTLDEVFNTDPTTGASSSAAVTILEPKSTSRKKKKTPILTPPI